jgi:hypothetical protein
MKFGEKLLHSAIKYKRNREKLKHRQEAGTSAKRVNKRTREEVEESPPMRGQKNQLPAASSTSMSGSSSSSSFRKK